MTAPVLSAPPVAPYCAPFVALIEIDTDDDFHVDIEGQLIPSYGSVRIEAPSAQDALTAALAAIDSASLPWAKSWAVEDSQGRREGTYARQWADVKAFLHEAVSEDPTAMHWQVGGNQSIGLSVMSAQQEALSLGLEPLPFGWHWQTVRESDGVLVAEGFSREGPPQDTLEPGCTRQVTPLHRRASVE